ncbi:MAG: MATE family efflux transporter [Oscillospiraceae bacterium]|nr:MATE family efflux transporter [Oscillospiraceae bacterium]
MSQAQAAGRPENKMGVMPIPKLLISMALPMMIAMLVQALYNVVDSIFVSQLGENALTAVSLAFPIQNLMIAVATGTGVGVNALLSKSLGEKNFPLVNKAAINAVFLYVCSYLLFLVFGLTGVRFFFTSQTDVAEIVEYGVDYLQICCIASFGLFLQICFERLLQSTGKTFHTMLVQGVGAVMNIILDPIFIFGLLGMPRMEVAGAALATVLGQIGGMLVGLFFNLAKNPEIHLSLRGFRPDWQTIKRIYAVGVPSIVMASISSVMTFGVNKILLAFSSTATAAFGVYFKLQSFIFMPVFGLNNGMVPIISYNYGARNKARIIHTIKLSIAYAVLIMVVGFGIFQLFPDKLLAMFNASPELLAIGVPSLRIISVSFLFAGFCIVAGSVFQSMGNGVHSLIVSVARQLVVLLPVAFLLSLTGRLEAVWWAFPIAELVSVALSSLFLFQTYKRVIKPIGTENQ